MVMGTLLPIIMISAFWYIEASYESEF